jgi:hypothetical protein
MFGLDNNWPIDKIAVFGIYISETVYKKVTTKYANHLDYAVSGT